MLEFTEEVLSSVRKLRKQSEDVIVSGGVKDMEHYKFLMGRIEGYKFVEMAISDLLKKNSNS
jgi:uncharacterized protein related to proFAR isomerase